LASNTIFDYDGTLDKLVGDQVMAFFGAPLYTEDHPERAVQAALQIIRGMSGLAQVEHLHVGAGIATGEAFVGNVGEGAVADYTVLEIRSMSRRVYKERRLRERYFSPKTLMLMSSPGSPMPRAANWNSKAKASPCVPE
jgi:hypothetical protein